MEIIIKCSDDVRGSTNIYGEPIKELVRCKDCKWHTSDDECIAPNWDFEERVVYPTTYSDDFCSYGEREGER